MQKLTMFYFEACPYCRQARFWMRQLIAEDPKYAAVQVDFVDEKRNPVLADKYDYWYVPSFFLGEEKLHEGEAAKEDVRRLFERALETA